LISISLKQWTSLLSDLLLKCVTPLSIIVAELIFLMLVKPSFPVGLQVCTWLDCVLLTMGSLLENKLQCNFTIISFTILKLNKLQSRHLINVSVIFYITVMYLLSFGSPYEMFSCFVLRKCKVSCPQASEPNEGSKGLRSSKWANGNFSFYHP